MAGSRSPRPPPATPWAGTAVIGKTQRTVELALALRAGAAVRAWSSTIAGAPVAEAKVWAEGRVVLGARRRRPRRGHQRRLGRVHDRRGGARLVPAGRQRREVHAPARASWSRSTAASRPPACASSCRRPARISGVVVDGADGPGALRDGPGQSARRGPPTWSIIRSRPTIAGSSWSRDAAAGAAHPRRVRAGRVDRGRGRSDRGRRAQGPAPGARSDRHDQRRGGRQRRSAGARGLGDRGAGLPGRRSAR
jgi:hypothetical protein